MLIDFHTHTFPDKIAAAALEQLGTRAGISPHTDGTYQGLKDAMARDGVDISVVLPVATNPAQVEKINRRALATERGCCRHRHLLLWCDASRLSGL